MFMLSFGVDAKSTSTLERFEESAIYFISDANPDNYMKGGFIQSVGNMTDILEKGQMIKSSCVSMITEGSNAAVTLLPETTGSPVPLTRREYSPGALSGKHARCLTFLPQGPPSRCAGGVVGPNLNMNFYYKLMSSTCENAAACTTARSGGTENSVL